MNAACKAAQIQLFEAKTVPNHVELDNSVKNGYNLFTEPFKDYVRMMN
jgi:hypothetical protein